MTSHHALIVEDDPFMQEELKRIADSLGVTSHVVDNEVQALEAIGKERFCFVLLDLQIKPKPDSLRAYVDAGRSVLLGIRKAHPDLVNGYHRLPVLLVSGFAREAEEAMEALRDGADDVIQKPLDRNKKSIQDRIRSALERSGRSRHDDCADAAGEGAVETNLMITIPGVRAGKRRTRIEIDGRPAPLADTSFRILLGLILAKLQGGRAHKSELKATDKQISRLREELLPALPEGPNIILNHYNGYYELSDDVVIGPINLAATDELGGQFVKDIVAKLRILPPQA